MRASWSDVNARVAGLSTRLLGPAALAELRGARSLADVAPLLAANRYAAATPGAPTVAALEQEIRGTVADRLALLDRWLGRRRDALRVLYEDEERRSIRSLLRGAAQGAPAEQRLTGLVPTAGLPEPMLQRLAGCSSPLSVVDELESSGHPFAAGLREAGVGATVDLYRLELALDRTFAGRARDASRHPVLRGYAERLIDLRNAWAALLAEPPGPVSGAAADSFVEGGRGLDAEAFRRITEEADPRERRRLLAERFAGSFLGPVLEPGGATPVSLETAALEALVGEQVRAKRRDPTSPAPIVLYALRLRADTVELRRILWALALRRPSGVPERGPARPAPRVEGGAS